MGIFPKDRGEDKKYLSRHHPVIKYTYLFEMTFSYVGQWIRSNLDPVVIYTDIK